MDTQIPDQNQAQAPSIQGPQQEPDVKKTNESKSRGKIIVTLFGVLFLIALIAAGIFISVGKKTAIPPTPVVQKKPLITIAVNPWKASELNATIAKVILEEKMGYQVKLISIGEYDQWPALAKGQIDASLEVWPSGHKKDVQKYIDSDKSVENGGPLGPVGKIGWYIPTYVMQEHPELASWKGLQDPKNVALFAATPGGKGQFFTGDRTWTQYDDQIIKNLGLNFEVKTLGSEEALLSAVDQAYHQKKPILFYFWTPHWAQSIYDLSQVALPPYTDACYSNLKSGVNCDYPSDKLFKVFWSGFKSYAPQAYEFLKNFNYTNQDQISMLAAVQIDKTSVTDIAHQWVSNNESKWSPWLPKN